MSGDAGQLDIGTTFDNEVLQLPEKLPIFKGGYNLLVFPIGIKSVIKGAGGTKFILPESTVDNYQQLITAGIVVKQGPLAFKHHKFQDPDTNEYFPICEPGDFVVFSRASFAQTINHGGARFYILPDDSVLYTIDHIKDLDPKYDYDDEEIESLKKQIVEINKTED